MKFKFTFVLLFLWARIGQAHDPGLSTLKLQHDGREIRAELIFSPADMEAVVPLDKNSDGKISNEEIAAAQPTLQKLAKNLLEVSINGTALVPSQTKCTHHTNDNLQFAMIFESSPGSQLKAVSKWFNFLPAGHRQFVSFQEGTGPAVTEDLLDAANNIFIVSLVPSLAATPTPHPASFRQFFVLGIEHILTGYDHLLFLFALLIVCESFAAIAKIVTCFTLAHSLTLVLATLNIVQIDSDLIEPLIAVSIIYVGLENIFRRGHPKGRWLLTFAFGLVHGFGFAGILREMEIAKAGSVIMPLVSFNLGVETGQIAVAAIILPLIWRLKKQPTFEPRWVPACSALVAAAGTFWFIQRVWF